MTKFLSLDGLSTLVTKVKAEIKKVSDASIPTSQKGAKSGVATLDSNGYVPLSQLGNLDTTVAEVVTSLPTTNIKKHIYMVASSSTTSQNVYKEYIYTGNPASTYDASKWEQLGEYKANVDLSGYLTKTDASSTYLTKTAAGSYLLKTDAGNTYLTKTDASNTYLTKTSASSTYATKTELSTSMGNIQTIQEKEITDLFT